MGQRSFIGADAEVEFGNKQFRLNALFQHQMLQIIASDMQLNFLQPVVSKKEHSAKKVEKVAQTFERIERESQERWRRIIYFLLNIEGPELASVDDTLRHTYISLLTFADYMRQAAPSF